MFFFNEALNTNETYRGQLALIQRVNFVSMILMLNFLSLGFESNHVLERGQQNPMFLK